MYAIENTLPKDVNIELIEIIPWSFLNKTFEAIIYLDNGFAVTIYDDNESEALILDTKKDFDYPLTTEAFNQWYKVAYNEFCERYEQEIREEIERNRILSLADLNYDFLKGA